MHDLDTRTKQFGREIFARLDRQGPVLFTRAWLEDKLMGLGDARPGPQGATLPLRRYAAVPETIPRRCRGTCANT